MSKGNRKAFSMLELIVTIGLMGIILVMMSNVLVSIVLLSQKAAARSFAREEVAQVLDLLIADIRAASDVQNCEGTDSDATCNLVLDSLVTWRECPNGKDLTALCKFDANGSLLYRTSDNLKITKLIIEPGFEASSVGGRRNILITLAADHAIDVLNVKNIFRQNSVSTRNYLLL